MLKKIFFYDLNNNDFSFWNTDFKNKILISRFFDYKEYLKKKIDLALEFGNQKKWELPFKKEIDRKTYLITDLDNFLDLEDYFGLKILVKINIDDENNWKKLKKNLDFYQSKISDKNFLKIYFLLELQEKNEIDVFKSISYFQKKIKKILRNNNYEKIKIVLESDFNQEEVLKISKSKLFKVFGFVIKNK